MNESPKLPKKPFSIWPGLVTLGVLLILGLLDTGGNKLQLSVGAILILPPTLGGVLAANIAAYLSTQRRVVVTARLLCIVLTPLIALAGIWITHDWLEREMTREFVLAILGIFALVGGTVSPFVAAYAVYRQARRSGKSYEEAQALSRWDPDQFS